jgi:hypothetical protein
MEEIYWVNDVEKLRILEKELNVFANIIQALCCEFNRLSKNNADKIDNLRKTRKDLTFKWRKLNEMFGERLDSFQFINDSIKSDSLLKRISAKEVKRKSGDIFGEISFTIKITGIF